MPRSRSIAQTSRPDHEPELRRPRGGRPSRAAAAERDERLLEIATAMFMEQGFEATSMDRLAQAASVGKATLYARYADKTALFADVLRRRIAQVFEPLEEEFAGPFGREDLEPTLRRVAQRLVDKSLTPDAVALGRIFASQGPKFPELAQLFIHEGLGRQLRFLEALLARFADDPRYMLDDLPIAADLFLALVVGRASRLAIYGVTPDPAEIDRRTTAAVRVFVRGITR